MLKRVLSVLLAVVMVLPLLASSAMGAGAEDEIEFKYDDVRDYPWEKRVTSVEQNGKWGLVDKRTGIEILPCAYEVAPSDRGEGLFSDGQQIGEIWRYGYLDKTGKQITPYKYKETKDFSDGLAAVKDENDKWGFIDGTGTEVISPKYDFVYDFSKGMAVVCMGEFSSDEGAKYACVDKFGNEIVPFGKYDAISLNLNSNGFTIMGAKVDDRYKFGLIDNTGKEVLPCQYDSADFNHETSLWDNEGVAMFWLDGKITIVGEDGRVILQDAEYDGVRTTKMSPGEDLREVRCNDKWGCIDAQTGEEVIPCKYDDIYYFGDGYIGVCLDEKWGMITKTGEEVVPCIYDDAIYDGEYITVYLDDKVITLDRIGGN